MSDCTEAQKEILVEMAESLERRARWKFKAGERLWEWSEYGAKDDYIDKPGEKALMMCALSGQMERDAKSLRVRAEEL